MKKFIGRKRELDALEAAHCSSGSTFVPVYGRRRVGKSELLLRFMKGKKGVYFTGKKGPANMQMQEFLREASVALDEPLLAGLAPSDWGAVLRAVAGGRRRRGKMIVAFDEFQWTVEESPELPSVLQELLDRDWKEAGNVMLIICGSYVGFMEREILGRRSPLFGRRTAQIFLRPFAYHEAAGFHPSFSMVDRARAYFICGGIPLYLQFFSDSRSIEKNLEENVFNPHAPLFNEPDFLLREELRDLGNYYAILTAVAEGSGSHSLIAKKAGLDSRALHYYLKQLVDLGYLARKYPLTGRRPPRRHVRYVLGDPLLRFWFRFVYPNMSYILQAGGAKAFRERVAPGLEPFFGLCFERMCREALPAMYASEGVNAAFDVGEYWDRNVQIDVVGRRDDGWIDLGESKWGALRSIRPVESELLKKAQHYPNPKGATVSLHVFTRNPVPAKKRKGSSVRWHALKDMYAWAK